jgi:hypothetical protein
MEMFWEEVEAIMKKALRSVGGPGRSLYGVFSRQYKNPNIFCIKFKENFGNNMTKNSLVGNINKRKKAGTSRSKKNSTVSDKAYKDMKAGWPKKGRKTK